MLSIFLYRGRTFWQDCLVRFLVPLHALDLLHSSGDESIDGAFVEIAAVHGVEAVLQVVAIFQGGTVLEVSTIFESGIIVLLIFLLGLLLLFQRFAADLFDEFLNEVIFLPFPVKLLGRSILHLFVSVVPLVLDKSSYPIFSAFSELSFVDIVLAFIQSVY